MESKVILRPPLISIEFKKLDNRTEPNVNIAKGTLQPLLEGVSIY